MDSGEHPNIAGLQLVHNAPAHGHRCLAAEALGRDALIGTGFGKRRRALYRIAVSKHPRPLGMVPNHPAQAGSGVAVREDRDDNVVVDDRAFAHRIGHAVFIGELAVGHRGGHEQGGYAVAQVLDCACARARALVVEKLLGDVVRLIDDGKTKRAVCDPVCAVVGTDGNVVVAIDVMPPADEADRHAGGPQRRLFGELFEQRNRGHEDNGTARRALDDLEDQPRLARATGDVRSDGLPVAAVQRLAQEIDSVGLPPAERRR